MSERNRIDCRQQMFAQWLIDYDALEERFRLGSIVFLAKDYPLATFLMGCLFQRIPHIEPLFELLESLTLLRKHKLLSFSLYKQFLQLLYDNPLLLNAILSALHQIKQKGTDPLIQFQALLNKVTMIPKDNSYGQNVRDGQITKTNLYRTATIQLQSKEKENRHNKLERTDTIELQQTPDLEQTPILDPEPMKYGDMEDKRPLKKTASQIERNEEVLKKDEELARKMWQQIQQQQRNYKQEVPCVICQESLYDAEYEPLQNCDHIFHKECLLQSFKIAITSNNFPLRCLSCPKQLSNSEIRRVLPKDWLQKYNDNTLKFYAQLHGDSVSWCPTADCGYLFFFEKEDETRFRCEDCHKEYCLECRVEWHKDMTCKEYQITHTKTEDDEKFLSFVKGKKFKQCPKCKFWVEKNEGCDHMTCKCKFQFCYKCGGIYLKCECTEKIRAAAEARRVTMANRKLKKAAAVKAVSDKVALPSSRRKK